MLGPKSAIGFVAALACLGGWFYTVSLAAPAFQALAQPGLGFALVGLPPLAVGCLWWGSRSTSLTPLQQKRLSEKADVANEQAVLKINALEAKIKTLETALSKVMRESRD